MAQTVKNQPAVRDPRFHPRVGKIPWRRKGQPTPEFLHRNPTDRGAWWATVHEAAKSQTAEQLTLSFSLIFI